MRIYHIIIMILITSSSFGQELHQYRWQNRVILISGDTASSIYLKQIQLLNLEKLKEPLAERKLLIITNELNAKGEDFNIKLIGLDGGEKLNCNDFINPQIILDLIDSMPMRISEMKRKAKTTIQPLQLIKSCQRPSLRSL